MGTILLREFQITKQSSLSSVIRFRQSGVPKNIPFTNNVVDNNSLLWLPEVILSTCITYEQNNFVPLQLSPFFINPSLHWQLYDPSVFLHSELATVLHGSPCAHSSISDVREYYMDVFFIHLWNNHRACKMVSTDFQSEGEKK